MRQGGEITRPTRCRDKWRIRWFHEKGKRKSAVFDTHDEAETELHIRLAEVAEIKRGLRDREPPERRRRGRSRVVRAW